MDGKQNTLVNASMLMAPVAADYRGVRFTIPGDSIKLSWEIEKLASTDTNDPITSVRYDDLSAIWLYSATVPSSPAVSLADLVGQNHIDIQMKPN